MAIRRTTRELWAGKVKIRRKEGKTRGGQQGQETWDYGPPTGRRHGNGKGKVSKRRESSSDLTHRSTDVRPFFVTLRVREDIPDLLPAHKNTQRLNHQKLLSLTKPEHPQLCIRKTRKKNRWDPSEKVLKDKAHDQTMSTCQLQHVLHYILMSNTKLTYFYLRLLERDISG